MDNVSQKQEKIYFGLDISQKTIEIFALKGETGQINEQNTSGSITCNKGSRFAYERKDLYC